LIAVTRDSGGSGDATRENADCAPAGARSRRARADSAAKDVTHRIGSIERAVVLLVAKHGRTGAQNVVRRELGAARQARSRVRYEFWTQVGDRIGARGPAGDDI
jgi:hypothetical protein